MAVINGISQVAQRLNVSIGAESGFTNVLKAVLETVVVVKITAQAVASAKV